MRESKVKRYLARTARAVAGFEWMLVIVLLLFAFVATGAAQTVAQSQQLTPLQLEIEKQRLRLNSSETEERRDAVMRLGWMKRTESSRVAASALRDSDALIRATAARAVLSLPPEEAAALLLPNLRDRDEFVRQETAYALGETKSRAAVSPLLSLLEKEKTDSVRGAIVVALGQIGDESVVIPLSQLLSRRIPASGILNKVRRRKKDENEFVRRAAAHSLGQIRSRAAVPALVAVLVDLRAPADVRREAAASLGLIGDPQAASALSSVLEAEDPYLSEAARAAILKLERERSGTLNSHE